MSGAAAPPEPLAPSMTQGPQKIFGSCWSCRLISGGGLLLSGAYVFNEAYKVTRRGGPASLGTVFQITFAASLAAWGVVLITDPVGKSRPD